jgi:hypothetical protein
MTFKQSVFFGSDPTPSLTIESILKKQIRNRKVQISGHCVVCTHSITYISKYFGGFVTFRKTILKTVIIGSVFRNDDKHGAGANLPPEQS